MNWPIKLGVRVRMFWQHDITEDMWSHGVLFGVVVARFLGWWRLDGKEEYDSYFCYIGFGVFYIRFVLKIKASILNVFSLENVTVDTVEDCD